jgi:hypothetical protein
MHSVAIKKPSSFARRHFDLSKAKYGPDDYDTLMTMHNLGANLRALGRYADALRLDEETRARRIATLGVDHPDTPTSLWSMAQDLIKLDRGALALPLLDECLQRAVGKRIHRNFPEVADYRLRYFERAHNAHECRTTAELWEKEKRTDADSLYQAAVCGSVDLLDPGPSSESGLPHLSNDHHSRDFKGRSCHPRRCPDSRPCSR